MHVAREAASVAHECEDEFGVRLHAEEELEGQTRSVDFANELEALPAVQGAREDDMRHRLPGTWQWAQSGEGPRWKQ